MGKELYEASSTVKLLPTTTCSLNINTLTLRVDPSLLDTQTVMPMLESSGTVIITVLIVTSHVLLSPLMILLQELHLRL